MALIRITRSIKGAADAIKAGRIVAYPTETVYGLGALALEESTVRKVIALKQATSSKPISLAVSQFGMIKAVAYVEDVNLLHQLLPGPVTVLLRKKDIVPGILTADTNLVGIRFPGTYTPGVRGKKWFKIKPAETLDLVIIGADWGSGRRRGWLSNYHLAVRDDQTGNYLDVGKTFKGLTDEEFKEVTSKLLGLKTSENDYTVLVKPSIVVEVAFNEIQRSPHYKSRFALRFARIAKFREDKRPEDADTLQRLQSLYDNQFKYKARVEL